MRTSTASTRDRLAVHFPAFGLEVRTPRLSLRVPDDGDLVDLAELAVAGIHPDDQMPFAVPWTRVPPPFQQRNTLQWFWSRRAMLQSDEWSLPLAAVVDGRVVGVQDLLGRSWAATRSIETGSWLGRAHQGLGLGREMRVAALHLAFDGFGADRAVTEAYADNHASLRVTEALGYRPNGEDVVVREGRAAVLRRFVMDRHGFDAIRRDDVEITGAAGAAATFGTERPPEGSPKPPETGS